MEIEGNKKADWNTPLVQGAIRVLVDMGGVSTCGEMPLGEPWGSRLEEDVAYFLMSLS